MANSGFDPLRNDPFAPVPQMSPAIVPVSDPNQPSNQWGLQQQIPPEEQLDSDENFLNQFNNTNSATNDIRQNRRMRANSHGSTTSSIGSRSARSSSKILNDPTIAPPPEVPIGKDYSRSLFHAEEEINPAPPPDFNEITHSGYCLARISMRTLVMKKWKRVFWISYGEDTLLFFREKDHFDDWAMNPHLSKNQREELVKLRINVMDPNTSTRKDTERITGFHASKTKAKSYKNGGFVHQFKLDKWTDQGPTIAAAFGSQHAEEIRDLHLIVMEMLRASPLSAAVNAAMAELKDRDGDSSGYFSSSYSVGSNPTFARPDDRSYTSGHSTRSAGSTGSGKKYLLNSARAGIRN